MKGIIILLSFLFAAQAQADLTFVDHVAIAQQKSVMSEVETQALNWVVGENAQYNLNMGFISGTMDSRVREEVNEGFWVEQNMDLGFMGKQKVEILFDRHTGQILEMRVNGEKQNPPDAGNQEVVDMQESSVTVPAGSFDCIFVKVKDTDSGDITQAWLNPELIPISGMIKTIAPSQFGEVVVELTNYQKM